MGSRFRRYAALVALAFAASCTVGAPPGFSAGDRWTIPLIGPLEDGLLLVPAWVNDKGPFVFAIDTDASVSVIDTDVVKASGARTGDGPNLLDESDTQQDRVYAEILEWDFGMLSVKNKPAEIVPAHTFDVEGRRIHGVIGRDILADSLTFEFDRDRGLITLTTKKAFRPAPNATRLGYSVLPSQIKNVDVAPMSRRLIDAVINGERFRMHFDLGAVASQLRARAWTQAKLAEAAVNGGVVDEVGMPRKVTRQGVAASAVIGALTSPDVAFIPYEDKRWPDQDLDGTLGLGLFKPFSVAVDWDDAQLYLRPRTQLREVVSRISRWQSKTLASCVNTGCVKITLIDPVANKPAEERPAVHPGVVVSVVREADAVPLDLEVLVAVTAADGATPLKWLIVNMPAGTDRALAHVSADYVGATTAVLDASPFPRQCPGQGGCIDLLTPPQPYVASTTPERQTVPPAAVKLRQGEHIIGPDDADKVSLNGARLIATFKVCADVAGNITEVTKLKSSGVPHYDAKLERTIRAGWAYEPFLVDGKPAPFCTATTFIYTQR